MSWSSRAKTHQTNFVVHSCAKGAKIGPEITAFLPFSQVWLQRVASRGRAHTKKCISIFSILMLSSIHSNLLVFSVSIETEMSIFTCKLFGRDKVSM